MLTFPPTLIDRLNDASRSTFKLSLVVIALVTNNRSLSETSLLNVFAGNTPPEIELGKILPLAKLLNAKFPVIEMSFTVSCAFTFKFSFIVTFLLNSAVLATNSLLFTLKSVSKMLRSMIALLGIVFGR